MNLHHELDSLRKLTKNLEEQTNVDLNEVQLLSTKLDQLKTDLLTSEVRGHVEEQLRQTRAEIQQSFKAILRINQLQLESQRMDSNTEKTSILAECRMEIMEEYSRRDMILKLEEDQGEHAIQKVVETANAIGATLSADEISISHRLLTRIRNHRESRPVIAKLIRQSVKQQVDHSKHLLHHTENHFRVYIKEHLTNERARDGYLI